MPNDPAGPAPTKSLVTSKTLIVNAIIALAALYPPVGHWVSQHATLVLEAIGYANIALRLVTHSRLSLWSSDS
jgi:hypothetical protein